MKPPRSKKDDDAIVRRIGLKVLHENRSREELLNDLKSLQPRALGLPVDWNNNGRSSHTTAAAIIGPDGEELQSYARPPKNICGNCAKFNIERGRKEMIEQRFPERLVRENDWRLRHLTSSMGLENVGMCDESGGTMVTLTISNADNCPGFRMK